MDRSITYSIYIEPYKAVRLSGSHHLHIVDGTAWITAGQRDIIARAGGDDTTVNGSSAPVVITGLMGKSVTLEIEIIRSLN
jgi:hypothetical protein